LEQGRTRALLIDDDADSAALNRARLQVQGYVVAIARDLASATAAARANQADVIFVSAVKERVDTQRLIQGLRTEDATRHVPIQLIGDTSTPPPMPAGLNSVARTNW
jgi:PleD family two-component response regulator